MNITLFYYEDHLQKAVAINNSNNPHLETPLTLEQATNELLSITVDSLDDLSVVSYYGIFFMPQVISDLDEYEDIGIMMHILIPPIFEHKEEELVSYTIQESPELH